VSAITHTGLLEFPATFIPAQALLRHEGTLPRFLTRYVSNAQEYVQVDLKEVHKRLVVIDKRIKKAAEEHNGYLRELGLRVLGVL